MQHSDLYAQFVAYTRTLCPDVGEKRTLLAVSGGVDSVVMARLWQQTGWGFALAHAHFGLRGADSDADAALVEQMARQWEVPFFIRRFDTENYAAQTGVSIQMAARQLRYEWWEELAQEENFDLVATAHQRDDNVETVLYHFSRGTGIRGMAGIPPKQGRVIRPLLFAGRTAIQEYAEQQGCVWREDRSNADAHYRRNYIRHHLIPHFQELNPAFLETAARSIGRLRAGQANMEALLHARAAPRWHSARPELEKKWLSELPAPAEALRILLRPLGFTAEQARQIAEKIGETGFELSSPTHRLWVGRTLIEVLPIGEAQTSDLLIHPDDLMVRLPENGVLFVTPAAPHSPFPDGKSAIRVETSALRYPLKIRSRQPGDVFQPFGMQGHHQSVQDYFTNQKLSAIEKQKVRILENADGTIIWIIGHRADERFRVTMLQGPLTDLRYVAAE